MKKAIGLVLFICTLGMLIYFSLTARMGRFSDQAAMALLGLALFAITFILKRTTKTQ